MLWDEDPRERRSLSTPAAPDATSPAEIGYIRAFLAKFSCPAPRNGGAEGGDGGGDEDDDYDRDDDDDEECGGTLAPVAAAVGGGGSSSSGGEAVPTPTHYQCNSCGFLRSEEDFLRSLAALDDDGSDDDDEEMEDD